MVGFVNFFFNLISQIETCIVMGSVSLRKVQIKYQNPDWNIKRQVCKCYKEVMICFSGFLVFTFWPSVWPWLLGPKSFCCDPFLSVFIITLFIISKERKGKIKRIVSVSQLYTWPNTLSVAIVFGIHNFPSLLAISKYGVEYRKPYRNIKLTMILAFLTVLNEAALWGWMML